MGMWGKGFSYKPHCCINISGFGIILSLVRDRWFRPPSVVANQNKALAMAPPTTIYSDFFVVAFSNFANIFIPNLLLMGKNNKYTVLSTTFEN